MRKRVLLMTLAVLCSGAPVVAQKAGSGRSLPLGDGHVSDQPALGSVYACPSARLDIGALQTGPWIQGDRWWPGRKPVVGGAVRWPSARIDLSSSGGRRRIAFNNLPNHPTGIFPVAASDDAYRYDRNPNAVRPQPQVLDLPAQPEMAARPSCLGMGMIGVTLSGTALYSALDAQGRDAPAHELQDACHGHPEVSGQYHFHDLGACAAAGPGGLIGYALDGFGIYRPDGDTEKQTALDACHGHLGEVVWDGHKVVMYHYQATSDYPYTLGCFRGTPVRLPAPRPPPPPSP